MKLNMSTYLEHECISILALKTHFDYKESSMHNVLHPIVVGQASYTEGFIEAILIVVLILIFLLLGCS